MLDLNDVSRIAYAVSSEAASLEFDKAIIKGLAKGWAERKLFADFLRNVADELEGIN